MSALRPIWPLIALLVSGALLAGAHAFETFGHLAPCALCLRQREAHWVIVGLAAVLFVIVRFRPSLAALAALLLSVAFGWSVYQAGYHVAVEHHWIIAQCEPPRGNQSLVFDEHADLSAPQCDKPAWNLFGITMAGYNGIISLLMMLASFAVAFSKGKANG